MDRDLISGECLVAYAIQSGGVALARRVGFLMDRYGLEGSAPLLDTSVRADASRHSGPATIAASGTPTRSGSCGSPGGSWRRRRT